MDGNEPLDVILTSVDGLTSPQGLGLDVANGKMYWADSGNDRIRRANLDGSGMEDLVTSGMASPRACVNYTRGIRSKPGYME
jgi:sugar lactone lactonase YvrE